jgi:hypothetical protein
MKQYTIVTLLVIFYMLTGYCQQQQWQRAKGTEGIAISAIDVYRRDPDTMYATGVRVINGNITNGVTVRSTNRGESWDSISAIGTIDPNAMRVDPLNSNIIYASIPTSPFEGGNTVVMTTDGGKTWKILFVGRRSPAAVIEIDPVDLRTVYAGVGPGFIMRSSDRGQTWDTLYPPVNSMTSLAIAPTNDSIFYLAYGAGIMKSTDRGLTWFRVAFSFQVVSVATVAVDPRDANIVYAGVFSFGGTPGGVYKSTDGGTTWLEKNNGLDSTDWLIQAIQINPKNPRELFLAPGTFDINTNKRIVRSTNGGENWLQFNEGLPQSGGARSIIIDTLNNKVCCAFSTGSGDSSGIYIIDSFTSVSSIDTLIPKSFTLYQNYPNPFNNQTEINFYVSQTCNVKLDVYNVLGEFVTRIFGGNIRTGNYRHSFNASNFSSGVYFYRLVADNVIITRRMVLMK